jgi:hypothetical protein
MPTAPQARPPRREAENEAAANAIPAPRAVARHCERADATSSANESPLVLTGVVRKNPERAIATCPADGRPALTTAGAPRPGDEPAGHHLAHQRHPARRRAGQAPHSAAPPRRTRAGGERRRIPSPHTRDHAKGAARWRPRQGQRRELPGSWPHRARPPGSDASGSVGVATLAVCARPPPFRSVCDCRAEIERLASGRAWLAWSDRAPWLPGPAVARAPAG